MKNQTPIKDDFTLITGIGKETKKNLHNDGLHTFNQLAIASPSKIRSLLPKNLKRRIKDEDIERWITQAGELAQESEPVETPLNKAPQDNHQHYASFKIELGLNQKNEVRSTKIERIPIGKENAPPPSSWAYWDPKRMIDFMLEHAKLRVPADEPAKEEAILEAAPVALPEPVAETGIKHTVTAEAKSASRVPSPPVALAPAAAAKLQVMSVKVREGKCGTNAPLTNAIIGLDQDWCIEVEWQMTDAEPADLTGNWLLRIYLESIGPNPEYMLPHSGDIKIPLAEYLVDEPDGSLHTYRYVHNFDVAAGEIAIGFYDLVTAVTLELENGEPGNLANFCEGPMLKIRP